MKVLPLVIILLFFAVVASIAEISHISEDLVEPRPGSYIIDSLTGKTIYLASNGLFDYESEGKIIRLPRYEFDSTFEGLLMKEVIDSVLSAHCLSSLNLEFDAEHNHLMAVGYGNPKDSRGIIEFEDAHKPLYLDSCVTDSMLTLFHIKPCIDSIDVKYVRWLELDRWGYGAVFQCDSTGELRHFVVVFEWIPVQKVNNASVNKKWKWLDKYRKHKLYTDKETAIE